uniref:Uncharacterized protein si:dkey-196h17.9 n=1 Tax=Austrofundulus limnaeus TaxID=52670 RepID=A0A2I4CC20_AUSLI
MGSFKDKIKRSFKKGFRRPQKDSISPSTNNNNDLQEGLVHENPAAHDLFNTAEVERSQELHNVLSFSRTRSDGSSGSESDSWEHMPLLKPQDFPKPPADLDQDQNLKKHLVSLWGIVSAELERFCHSGSGEDLKNMIDSCHQRTFIHLHGLLQKIRSSENCFVLLTWVKQTYLSQEQLADPEPVLLTDWDNKARQKLIPQVQEEFSKSLSKILQQNRTQTIDDEETYVGLYVDVIQYTSSMIQKAQSTSPELHNEVQEVCSQELMNFVTSYTAEQAETLRASVQKTDETIHFLKTLRTCEELRKYVQLKENFSLKEEITSKLKDMEALILKLLMEIITELAERDLRGYFKKPRHQMQLLTDLKTRFPKTSYFRDEQKEVMAQAYEVIAHVYLKRLIRTSRWKLKLWSSAVGPKVSSDTEELQGTILDLAPGVQLGKVMLLSVPEVLKNKDIDTLKLILAGSQKDCGRSSKDLDLIPDLLRWKGLSRSQVTEVLEAFPEDLRPRTGYRWSFGCCCC